ncbi:MAG: lysophospholipase [Chloroflexi bacterium]|nr:lysophospholipase [Chloroflexota bacterium]
MPQHSEHRFAAADGCELYAQTWAADHTRAHLVMVHGLGEHSGRYQNYVDYFVPRGFTLHGADARGHGRSGGKPGYIDRFDQYVADIDRRVAHIRSADPATPLFVLGHSLGSLMTLKFGLDRPAGLSGIVVTGTALRDALVMPKWKRSLAGVLSNVTPSLKMDNGVLTKYLSHDPAVIAAFEADPLTHHWGTPRLATEAERVRTELYRRAGEWSAPLLMLHGGDDRVCLSEGARAFAQQVPTALVTYREFDGLYHEIHNERERALVFGEIEAWLEARLATPPTAG